MILPEETGRRGRPGVVCGDLLINLVRRIVVLFCHQDLAEEELRPKADSGVIGKPGADRFGDGTGGVQIVLLEKCLGFSKHCLGEHLVVRILRFELAVKNHGSWVALRVTVAFRSFEDGLGDER